MRTSRTASRPSRRCVFSHGRRSIDNPIRVSMSMRCFATRAATATSADGGRLGACCRGAMANVAVVGYASATSASALAVGSLRPDPSTRADRQPELLLGGAGYRAAWSRCGGWAARLPHALSEVDFLPHVLLSSCLFCSFSRSQQASFRLNGPPQGGHASLSTGAASQRCQCSRAARI